MVFMVPSRPNLSRGVKAIRVVGQLESFGDGRMSYSCVRCGTVKYGVTDRLKTSRVTELGHYGLVSVCPSVQMMFLVSLKPALYAVIIRPCVSLYSGLPAAAIYSTT